VVSVAHLAEVSDNADVSVGVENGEAADTAPPIPDVGLAPDTDEGEGGDNA
jgi:hypothetical protein